MYTTLTLNHPQTIISTYIKWLPHLLGACSRPRLMGRTKIGLGLVPARPSPSEAYILRYSPKSPKLISKSGLQKKRGLYKFLTSSSFYILSIGKMPKNPLNFIIGGKFLKEYFDFKKREIRDRHRAWELFPNSDSTSNYHPTIPGEDDYYF